MASVRTPSRVDTKTMAVKSTVDLNAPLVATGFLGDVTARPALAHPRSLVISNNGDLSDKDESIYATEYFAQATAPEAADGANSDVRKTGIVYRVKLSDHSVNTIPLAPLWKGVFASQRLFDLLLAGAERFDNRPGRLYSFVCTKARA